MNEEEKNKNLIDAFFSAYLGNRRCKQNQLQFYQEQLKRRANGSNKTMPRCTNPVVVSRVFTRLVLRRKRTHERIRERTGGQEKKQRAPTRHKCMQGHFKTTKRERTRATARRVPFWHELYHNHPDQGFSLPKKQERQEKTRLSARLSVFGMSTV